MAQVISYPNNEINFNVGEGTSNLSAEKIKLLNIDVSETTLDTYIEVTIGSRVTTLWIEEVYKNPSIDIIFLNSNGGQQTLTFFKPKEETMTATKDTFESDRGQPNAGKHQFVDFNLQARTKFKVNSGWVYQHTNDDFKQLVLSSRIYLNEGTGLIPLNMTKKSITYKTRLKEKLIEYEFDFEYSYNEVQNI